MKTASGCWKSVNCRVLTSQLSAIQRRLEVLRGSSTCPSQSDVWVLARGGTDLVSIVVEGNVSEPFGLTLEDWRKVASPGKEKRLSFICNALSLNHSPVDSIRYQLIHRTASAVVKARRFNAAHGMMPVHPFLNKLRIAPLSSRIHSVFTQPKQAFAD